MNTKLKALSLGLLATVAVSAVGVMNATANSSGHFNLGAGAKTVTGIENAEHNLIFKADTGGEIDCTVAHYEGNVSAGTTGSIDVTPKYEECSTVGSASHNISVHVNGGCTLRFTVGLHATTEDNTVDVCPQGGAADLTITHPNCTITIDSQTIGDAAGEGGVSSHTITQDGKHAITLTSTAKLSTTYVGGICVLLGKNHTAEMLGSATVVAKNEAGEPVDITATGSED